MQPIQFSAFFDFSFDFFLQICRAAQSCCLLHTCQLTICAFDFHPIFIFSTRPRFPLLFPLFYSNTTYFVVCISHFSYQPTYIIALLFEFFGAKRDATTTPPPNTTQHHITRLHTPSTIYSPHQHYYSPPTITATTLPTTKVKQQGSVAHAFASISALAF